METTWRRMHRRYWPNSAYAYASRLFPSEGGFVGAIGPIVGGVETSNHDASGLGRWTLLKLRGRGHRMLTIISAYRVSQSTLTAGHDTAYNQQYRALRRQGIQHPKPKLQFIKDLITTINNHKREGEVIVMLDANSELTDSHMSRLLNQTELFDVMGYSNTQPTPNTYIRGPNTIDFILATAPLLPTIKQAGMLAFKHGILSDHRGLWIDMNYKDLSTDLQPTSDPYPGKYIPTTK